MFWRLRLPATGASADACLMTTNKASLELTGLTQRYADDLGRVGQARRILKRQDNRLRLTQLLRRLGYSDSLAGIDQYLTPSLAGRDMTFSIGIGEEIFTLMMN